MPLHLGDLRRDQVDVEIDGQSPELGEVLENRLLVIGQTCGVVLQGLEFGAELFDRWNLHNDTIGIC